MTPGAPSAAERAPKVAITGAGGFVGKHLVQALTAAQPDWALICPEGRSVAGGLDVTDPTAMDAWVRREQPDMDLPPIKPILRLLTSLRLFY